MGNPAAGNSSPEMMNALSALGKMLNIASVYGMAHPSMARPLKEAHQLLSDALKQEKKVSLGLFNQTLTIDDKMVSEYTVHLRALERKFIALDIPHLVFHIGLSAEEFEQFVQALCETGVQPGGNIKERVDRAGFEFIKADTVEYVAQHEGQRLVGEDEGGKDLGSGGNESKKEEQAVEINIGQIVAFLKGDPSSGEPPAADLQKMLSDPEKLGKLIMESIAIRESAHRIDSGESLADIVVGCLRRTYDGLAEQKKYTSSRGKASLNKAMLLLEKTVVDKIRSSIGDDQPDVDEHILEALREAEEKRQVEILAARYAEQQKKITKTELDMLKYIREHGEEKARVMLDCAYVPDQDWNRLTTRARQAGSGQGSGGGQGSGTKTGTKNETNDPSGSGAGETAVKAGGNTGLGGAGGEIGGGDAIDMGALAIVLDKLETIMDLDNIPPEIITSAVQDVREQSGSMSDQLEKQVKKIEADVAQHEADSSQPRENRTGTKSRADILLAIAQLSLKLAQPLTVITASVEGALMSATNPALVRDLLEMADESGKRMTELMKRLTGLVGYPSMQEADKNILLYD
jgi:histone H3/H4